MKFGMRVRALDSLPRAKFCKNRLRGYTTHGRGSIFYDPTQPISLQTQPTTDVVTPDPTQPNPTANINMMH